MGVDIAVCFSRTQVDPDALAQAEAVKAADAVLIYFASGPACADSAQLRYFSLWADDRLDLHGLCSELSRSVSPICIAWKSEHGGVGGYVVYRDGGCVDDVSSDSDYLELPCEGVEKTFELSLALSSSDRLFFPELLLTPNVEVHLIRRGDGQAVEQLPNETLTALLEDDLDVEPIFPFDTW